MRVWVSRERAPSLSSRRLETGLVTLDQQPLAVDFLGLKVACAYRFPVRWASRSARRTRRRRRLRRTAGKAPRAAAFVMASGLIFTSLDAWSPRSAAPAGSP